MLNLDPAKLLVIVVIVVIGFMVIGPERMPRVARQLGTMLRTVRSYREQAESEIRKAIPRSRSSSDSDESCVGSVGIPYEPDDERGSRIG